jgi:exodeoxyribonuclease V gamma subunit
MISTYRSNRLISLAQHLAERLEATVSDDPFEGDLILVPNLDTARWLKTTLAEMNGFAGNLHFQLPAEWQYSCIRELYPDLPKRLPSDPDPLKWAIYELLLNEKITARFDKLNRFLNSQPQEKRDEAALAVAGQLASLFDQYLIYRPEMIIRWQNGKIGSGDEQWQAGIWNLLDKKWKSIHQKELKKNKAELYTDALQRLTDGDLKNVQPIHLFNPGLIAEPIVRMIEQASKHHSVDIYLVQPSGDPESNSHPLISSLGKESEAVNTLFYLPGSRIVDSFPDTTEVNNLTNIQKSIIQSDTGLQIKPENEDLSGVEVRSCHSAVREIEVLRYFLLSKFEEDSSLHPDDILVVAPNLDNYQSAIHAVFGITEDGLPTIPYFVSGRNLSEADTFERAFLHILSLADSRFSFTAVMDLFMMRSIREQFRVSESEASTIKRWMEDNNVHWGLDENHRTESDQPGEHLQTWNSAMRRGWLGQWMGSEPGDIWNDTLLFNGVRTTSDQKIWAQFSNYLYRLNRIRNEVKTRRSPEKWYETIEKWLELFFSQKDLTSDYTLNTRKVFESMREHVKLAGFKSEVSYSVIKSELEKKLEEQRSGSAQFHRGITFSTMVPVRSIPFRIIAMIGLNEGTFPRKVTAPDYDLMVQYPKPTDRNRRNEDRNLFLESILAAGEIHYCSYEGQSIIDNETIPPSPIVSDWVDYLSTISGLSSEEIIKKEALSSFSPSSFKTGKNYSKLSAEAVQNILDSDHKNEGLKFENSLPDGESLQSLDLRDLISFYSNPIRTLVRSRFGSYLRDIDEERDEFNLSHLDKHLLFEKVFGWVINHKSDEQVRKLILNSGLVPAGWPGEHQVVSIIESVKVAIEQIKSHRFDPAFNRLEISCILSGTEIQGSIQSYSSTGLLDLSFSKMSGKNVIQTWIKHLLISVADSVYSDSYLICEPKKGDPKLIHFKKVNDPESILKNLITFFEAGLKKPLLFFPKTLFTYENLVEEDANKAWKDAKREFEGDDFGKSYPERDDLNISFLLGEGVEFGPEIVQEEYRTIIREMLNHMEEKS